MNANLFFLLGSLFLLIGTLINLVKDFRH